MVLAFSIFELKRMPTVSGRSSVEQGDAQISVTFATDALHEYVSLSASAGHDDVIWPKDLRKWSERPPSEWLASLHDAKCIAAIERGCPSTRESWMFAANIESFGWPARCFCATTLFGEEATLKPLVVNPPALRIVWLGWIVDTAIAYFVVIASVATWAALRTSRRLSRGRCPNCAYELRPANLACCPECGWNTPLATP